MPHVGDLLSGCIPPSYRPGTGTATEAQLLAALATQSVDTEILGKHEKIKQKRRAWLGLRRIACERRPSPGQSLPTGSLPLLNTPPLANSKVPCPLAWPLPSPRLRSTLASLKSSLGQIQPPPGHQAFLLSCEPYFQDR